VAPSRKVHLPIVGAERDVDLPVPGGTGSLTSILPAARRLSDAVMTAAEEARRAVGHKVTCKLGCAACCRHLVPVSLVEARALLVAIERLPAARREAVRRRFAAALERMESEGLLRPRSSGPARTALVSRASGDASVTWGDVNRRYFALQIACPLLENERCVVYEDRPFVCREYRVTSDPLLCRTLDDGVEPVPRPMYMTRALSKLVEQLEGVGPRALPLPLLVEWGAERAADLASDHDAAAALEALLEAIEWHQEDVDG
jgi:Fe-S-cluster containining protein